MSESARRRRSSRPSARRHFAAVAVVAALATLVAPASHAVSAPPFLSLEDIRPGMLATVKTVLQGTAITELQVEIVSVVHNTGPDQDIILAKGVGEPIGSLGVAQGMSGSPAYVDGKLVGAVSSTWSFLKEPVFGITPVQQMDRDAFRGETAAGKKNGARSSTSPLRGTPAPALLGAPSTSFRLRAAAPRKASPDRLAAHPPGFRSPPRGARVRAFAPSAYRRGRRGWARRRRRDRAGRDARRAPRGR
jgi:hypothetical protein